MKVLSRTYDWLPPGNKLMTARTTLSAKTIRLAIRAIWVFVRFIKHEVPCTEKLSTRYYMLALTEGLKQVL